MFFIGLMIAVPAVADTVYTYPEQSVASARLVEQAYNALDSVKQGTLQTDQTNPATAGNVRQSTQSGTSGAIVTGVTANNGIVTVAKGEITVPVGSFGASTRAQIWIE